MKTSNSDLKFSYSDEYRAKKAFTYDKKILPLFLAVVKFYSTNRLFTVNSVNFS